MNNKMILYPSGVMSVKTAFDTYKKEANKIWRELLEKHKLSEEEAIEIIEGGWYEINQSGKFEDEWFDRIGSLQYEIEKKYDVIIEHEDVMIIVSNDKWWYDGDTCSKRVYDY